MAKSALLPAVLLALLPSMVSAKNWTVDYAHSSIQFTGSQSGADFTGHFGKFTTSIDFDPAHPSQGKIAATIDIASAATGTNDIDGSLPQSDWFDSKKFPQAEFTSSSIKAGATDSCFNVAGQLTIKGIAKPVSFPFCLAQEGDHMRATGKVSLLRTDFNIGTGQWSDDRTVAHAVTVNLEIVAK